MFVQGHAHQIKFIVDWGGGHVTQNTRDLLPSSFWDGMFSRVSRREDNGETDKSSCILIVDCSQSPIFS